MGYAYLKIFVFKVYDVAKFNHWDTVGSLGNVSLQIPRELP